MFYNYLKGTWQMQHVLKTRIFSYIIPKQDGLNSIS